MMVFNEWLFASLFTLRSGELIILIAAATFAGYLVKLILDTFFKKKKSDSDLLELELESLQQTYNAQMVQKQEAMKILQNQVQAAEQKNFELQVEYAKALHHIEELKVNGALVNDAETPDYKEMSAGILNTLKEKLNEQDNLTRELQLQIEQKEIAFSRLSAEMQAKISSINDHKTAAEQSVRDYEVQLQQLTENITAKEMELSEQQQQLKNYENEMAVLKEQLSDAATIHEQKSERETTQLKDEIALLQKKLSNVNPVATEVSVIQNLRIEAGSVNTAIEQFQTYISETLTKTAVIEEQLLKNEQLNTVIDELKEEMHQQQQQFLQTEQRIRLLEQQLQEQSEQYLQTTGDMLQKMQEAQLQFEASHQQLQDELIAATEQYSLVQQEKQELAGQLQNLQHQVHEKEQFMLQMIETLKTFEVRLLTRQENTLPAFSTAQNEIPAIV
jgi:chromosome segregation ATPase